MAVILQKPEALSLSGNMNKFILSSGTVVTFILKEGATVLLDATYEPGNDGRVTIDVRDIIDARLSYLVSHEQFYLQTGIVKTFTVLIDGVQTTFRVIRAGVANLADTPENWLSGNFLTWQPLNKKVTYYSPEWLTYYATSACKLILKAYYNDGMDEEAIIGTMAAGSAYTANLQYAVVAGLLGQKYPQQYEVYVEDASGNRLSYIQKYYYSEKKSEQEQWFLFENSLGGLDTIRAYGDTDFTGAHDHKVAQSGDDSFEYDIDTSRTYTKSTGYVDEYERRWLLDFFPSRAKYIYATSALRPITVKESDVKYTASDLPSSYVFSFIFSDALPYLNLIRNEENIPENIVIPDIDSPDFSLPPRLSEYPRAQLHEGVIFPAFDPHNEKPSITTLGAILNAAVVEVLAKIQAGEGGGELVDILRSSDSREASDYSVFSSLRTMSEVYTAIKEYGADYYLSKLNPDTAREVITFLKGWSTNTFSQGTSGSALYRDDDGNWHIQTEYLHVLRKFTAEEIEIQKTSHIGGKLMQTVAAMTCTKVEEYDTFYRCYMKNADNEGAKIFNQFKEGDQALVETFNLLQQPNGNVGNHFLWRLVTAVGDDYIDMSKDVCALGSDAPMSGDRIVQLGYQGTDDDARQNAIIMAGAGEGSPYFKQYVGINSFTLPEEETRLKPGDNLFTGKLNIKPGSTGAANLSDFPDEVIKAVQVGSMNLLRNSGFTGDYESVDVENIDTAGKVFSEPLKYWNGTATVQDDSEAVSGFSAVIGSISQDVELIKNENYVVSLRAKGEKISVQCGGFTANQSLSDEYTRHVFRFKNDSGTFIRFNGTASICDVQLERGTIDTDYAPSVLDNDKSLAEFLSLQYLTSSINNASITTLGGLILSNIIMAGNYVDKKMNKVTAGMSGIYNNDDDVAFWSGGELLKAIKAVQAFKDNPAKELSDKEWEELANYTVTHGGRAIMNDIILRGYIYALGGIFRGRVESNANGNRIVIDPSDRSMKMITGTGREVIKISFRGERQADIKFYMYNDDGSIDRTTSFGTDEGYYVQRYGVNGNPLNLIRYGNDGQIANSYLPNLTDAQADAILVTGMWYRTGRTIKVKD